MFIFISYFPRSSIKALDDLFCRQTIETFFLNNDIHSCKLHLCLVYPQVVKPRLSCIILLFDIANSIIVIAALVIEQRHYHCQNQNGIIFVGGDSNIFFVAILWNLLISIFSVQRLDILGQLGRTPNFMLQPPKEHLEIGRAHV